MDGRVFSVRDFWDTLYISQKRVQMYTFQNRNAWKEILAKHLDPLSWNLGIEGANFIPIILTVSENGMNAV